MWEATRKKEVVLEYLEAKLHEKSGGVGTVKTVLTLSGTKVTIYGHFIEGDKVFALLNASCETAIVWRPWCQIKKWKKGFFVKLNEFEGQYDDDLWVALVGVPTNNFQEVIPY